MAAGTLDDSGGNPPCIMIVDPEEQIHAMLQSALGDVGFTTLCTKNAAAARTQLGHANVAVVIVEMMLRDTASVLIRELQSRGVPTIAIKSRRAMVSVWRMRCAVRFMPHPPAARRPAPADRRS